MNLYKCINTKRTTNINIIFQTNSIRKMINNLFILQRICTNN